jgi:carbonic anhydrase
LPLRFKYENARAKFEHRGTSLAIVPTGTQRVEIDGLRHDLVEILFHTPSEHKITGIGYDVEVQLIHRSTESGTAVVSVLFAEYDQPHSLLTSILKDIPEKGEARDITINPSDLLPKRKNYFTYVGSETTPPCSEGVSWYIFADSVSLSQKQLDILSDHIGQNARPIQPVGKRTVQQSLR